MSFDATSYNPKFRGVWVPADIWSQVIRKELNPTDLMVLMLVDSLVGERNGCTATNAYMAEELGYSKQRISKVITKLKRMGLVRDVNEGDDPRVLEAAWSRVARFEVKTESGGGRVVTRGVVASRPGAGFTKVKPLNNNTLDCYRSRGTGGNKAKGKVMPFLPEDKPSTTTPQAHEWAVKLHHAIVTKRKIRRAWNVNTWAKSFQLLLNDLEDHERLQRVLDWYVEHCCDQYVPQAWSGKSFREKFLQIEAAMARKAPEQPVDQSKLSPTQQEVLKCIGGKRWPKVTRDQVAAYVVDCSRCYVIISKHLLILAKKPSAIQWVSEQLLRTMGTEYGFVSNWVRTTWESVVDWDDWSGKFNGFRLHPTNGKFKAFIRKEVEKIAGAASAKYTDQILTYLEERVDENSATG